MPALPFLRRLSLTGALLLAGLPAQAQPDWRWLHVDAVFLQVAESARSRSVAIGASWDLPWQRDWAGGRLGSYVEASIGHWAIETPYGGRDIAAVSQIGLTPVLRWQRPDSRWFAEAGIGLNLIGPTYRAGTKRFSTAFNFGDHLAIGRQFEGGHEIALRVQHFSNAGIKQPNPGEDFVQLRWTVRQ